MSYPATDSFFDFDIKRLTNNVQDGQLMGGVIGEHSDFVRALFIIPSPALESQTPSDETPLQLIARKRVKNITNASFATLVSDRPDIATKYYNYALLIGDPTSPAKHTLITSANTRYLSPETFAKRDWNDLRAPKANVNEGQIPVLSLLLNCPKANLVFLENSPSWHDTDALKEAFVFNVQYEIESHYGCFWFELGDGEDDPEVWQVDY